MKKIEAIIRGAKMEGVKEALNEYGIRGMTVTNVLGCGKQKGKTEYYRGNEVTIDLLPKVKLEIITTDERVQDIIDIVVKNARTGQIGDGKIFVYNVEETVRIRTGDVGDSAI